MTIYSIHSSNFEMVARWNTNTHQTNPEARKFFITDETLSLLSTNVNFTLKDTTSHKVSPKTAR